MDKKMTKRSRYAFLDVLPDDIVLCILRKLVSSSSQPSDFFNAVLTCRRFSRLGFHGSILSKACPNTFAVDAETWCDSSHRFLSLCVDAGNVEASFTLGMIQFYCLRNREYGASLMAKASENNHAAAIYSLAVIHFNGSGGFDKDLQAGVAKLYRAAYLGHINATRELGHCLRDGYGVHENISEGQRFLAEARARERGTVLSATSTPDLVNKFLRDWFSLHGVEEERLRLCSHTGCGRFETKRREFRRCSICGRVNYCSRACQALDWVLRHKDCSTFD